MVARITAKEAAALGITNTLPMVPARKRTTRKAVTGVPYWSRCKKCGEEFTTVASEDRHLHDTHHARYEVLT